MDKTKFSRGLFGFVVDFFVDFDFDFLMFCYLFIVHIHTHEES